MSDVSNSTMQDALKFMNKYGVYSLNSLKNPYSSKSKSYRGPLTATDIATGGRFINTDSNGNRYF